MQYIKFKIGINKYELNGIYLFKNNICIKQGTGSDLKEYLRYRHKRWIYHRNHKMPRILAKLIGEPYIPSLPDPYVNVINVLIDIYDKKYLL